MTRVVDIREQYPLLELEETLEIAAQLGVAHPTDPKSKKPCVVTTDFLVNIAEGAREIEVAIAVKTSADLASPRTLEKLEIERIYWTARKIDWRILTEKELPRALVRNMRWVLPHFDLVSSGAVTSADVLRIRATMEPMVLEGNESLASLTAHCDDHLGLKAGTALCVARHLIAIRTWLVDLNVEINPKTPLQLLSNGGIDACALKLVA
jgi:hypothetical protein